METVNTTERLGKLRELMKEHKIDLYSKSVCWLLHLIMSYILKLYHRRIVINQSTLLLATLVEVSAAFLSALLIPAHSNRVHLWLHWLRRYCCHIAR